MTNVVEEDKAKTQPPEAFQNGDNSLSGSDSDNNAAKTTSSSCSSVASSSSSGTASKLAIRMADKVNLTSYPAEKRFKFEPNEDYLDQLLAMGISINGAKKALYYTGNRSVTLATNWIFDHPELDLETPLEEELRRLDDEELDEEALEEEEEDEEDSEEEALMRQHHLLHHHHHHNSTHHNHYRQNHRSRQHNCHDHEEDPEDEEEDEDLEDEEEEEEQGLARSSGMKKGIYYDVSDETDSESEEDDDDFDEEDIPEFKMVFVVNTSLDLGPGRVAAQVGHAALGVQRVLTARSNMMIQGMTKTCSSSSTAGQNKYKVSTTDLGLWQDFGEKMVVVKGESSQHLKDLHLMAEDLELPSFLVKDAGITQVPSGAVTVFGVFGEEDDVNKITGRLKPL